MSPLREAGRTAAGPRDLLRDPLWRAEDLGKPIPDSPHACSVAMPLWDDVVGYEEGRADIVAALQCGYPRFFVHPYVRDLFRECEARFGRKDEAGFAFPSAAVAKRCVDFVRRHAGVEARTQLFSDDGVTAVLAPEGVTKTVRSFWQHTGDIVSSRHALATMRGERDVSGGGEANVRVKQLLAEWSGARLEDVYLYPSGMGALAEAQRMMHAVRPGLKSVQLGFPYVDLLKVQEKIGPGVHFFSNTDGNALRNLEELLENERICGLFTEFPGNPLLRCPDVVRLGEALRKNGALFVIDETIGTFVNVETLSTCDAIMTSLTKFVSGVGDVIAGSLILNRDSTHYEAMRAYLQTHHEDLLWGEDAVVLADNARDFPERMAQINRNAEQVADHLHAHPAVADVMYPKFSSQDAYAQLQKRDGGYGGLLSLVTKDAAKTAPSFYDRLRISKGPSLGTNYSLACPFTLLAHFNELDWAESLGVSRWLVRVSVGLENPDDLIARFDEALAPG